jgi:putative aminopeptidase FrvX
VDYASAKALDVAEVAVADAVAKDVVGLGDGAAVTVLGDLVADAGDAAADADVVVAAAVDLVGVPAGVGVGFGWGAVWASTCV